MTEADINTLIGLIDRLTKRVRLSQSPVVGEVPEGCRLWVGSYAWLVLWPVRGTGAAAISTACAKAETYLDETMPPETARRGSVVDGYAVLAMTKAPSAEEMATVRAVELSPRLCRKHVVWLDGGDWGKRLATVTLLDLPAGDSSDTSATEDGAGTNYPTLPPDQDQLVKEIMENVKDAVAKALAAAGVGEEP